MSLTSHLNEMASPVRGFFSVNFPDAKRARMSCTVPPPSAVVFIRGVHRADVPRSGTWSAGSPRACPEDRAGYPWATVGTAFDYQLRFLLGQQDLRRLVAYSGAKELAAWWGLKDDLPRGFIELLDHVSMLRKADRNWARPATVEGKRKVARVNYALALYEQCFRAPIADTWPLLQLGKRAPLKKVFASIRENALDDLAGLSDLFVESQSDLLAARDLAFNPTFDASLASGGLTVTSSPMGDCSTLKPNSVPRFPGPTSGSSLATPWVTSAMRMASQRSASTSPGRVSRSCGTSAP